MTLTKESILAHLSSLADSKDYAVAEEFLRAPDTRLFDPEIAGKRAGERIVRPINIRRTWVARCKHAKSKGTPLYGCAEFIARLDAMPRDAELVGVALKGRKATGLFWFDNKTTEAVGFVISNRRILSEL